jgi:hypothetical protein
MTVSSTAFNLIAGGIATAPAHWSFQSTYSSTDFGGVSGFFLNAAAPGGQGIATLTMGIKLYDSVLAIQSTEAGTPGRCTWHSVISASAQSSAWGAPFCVTLSSTP